MPTVDLDVWFKIVSLMSSVTACCIAYQIRPQVDRRLYAHLPPENFGGCQEAS
jgi:hypothetical protein